MKNKPLIWVMVLFIVLVVPWPLAAVDDIYTDLDSTHSTANFDIFYTTDAVTWPSDWVSTESVELLGTVLEDGRDYLLTFNFDESPDPHYVYVSDIGALGLAWDTVSTWDSSIGDWISWQQIELDSMGVVRDMDPIDIRQVPIHEFFHQLQWAHRQWTGSSWWPNADWVIEGQAELMMDKVFTVCDQSPETGFFGNAWWYLRNPSWPLLDTSYGAALFWNYVTEQYGSMTQEPGYGLDAINEFWEAVDSLALATNEIEVFNEMLTRLGYSITFEEVFKNFVVANYAKDLTNSPQEYEYIDESQPPGTYGSVKFREDVTPRDGLVLSRHDIVERWTANYYRYDRSFQSSDLIEVDVNQLTNNELFFSLLLVKNDALIDEIRVTGTEFHRSLVTDADEVILIVAGLDNIVDSDAKYTYSISPGAGEISLHMHTPTNFFWDPIHSAYVGPYDDPGHFTAIVEVLDAASPVLGLALEDFEVEIASPSMDSWLATITSLTYVNGLYYLEIDAPIVPANDEYHLNLHLGTQSTWENYAVVYSEATLPMNTVIVIDKSGSMSYSEKIDAAQASAKLFVNSFPDTDYVSLVQFNEDALLLQGLAEVSTIRSAIITLIDGLTAEGWTSVGDGMFFAQEELYTNGVDPARFDHVILLTDGRENRKRDIDDVWPLLYYNDTILDVVLVGLDAQGNNLQRIAEWTGGDVYYVLEPSSGTLASDLASVYRSVAENRRGEQRVLSRMGIESGSWDILEEFELDTVSTLSVAFNYKSASSLSASGITLQIPGLGPVAPTFSSEKQAPGPSAFYGHFVWHVPAPSQGTYRINFNGTGDIEYWLEAGVKGPILLETRVGLLPEQMYYGSEVPIIVTLADDAPILNAEVIAEVSTGTSYLDAIRWNLTLYDDGAHNDGLPNDGVYGNWFTRTAGVGNYSGTTYSTTIRVDGVSNAGTSFKRSKLTAFYTAEDIFDDMDSDDLPDRWERIHGLDFTDATGDSGWDGDPDLDGLVNSQELLHGTSPVLSDTDRGGESDYSEVANGRDPYSRNDDVTIAPIIRTVSLDGAVRIHFSARSSHSTVNLYRSLDPKAGYSLIASGVDATLGNYTDLDVTNGITYYYRAAANGSSGSVSGLSHVSSATPQADVELPWGTVKINGGDDYSSSATVTLEMTAASDVMEMRISAEPAFDDSPWLEYQETASWTLEEEGTQFVFVQFRDGSGNIGGAPSDVPGRSPAHFAADSIIYDSTYTPTTPTGLPIGWILVIGGGAVVVVVIVFYIARRRGWIRI